MAAFADEDDGFVAAFADEDDGFAAAFAAFVVAVVSPTSISLQAMNCSPMLLPASSSSCASFFGALCSSTRALEQQLDTHLLTVARI